MTTLLLTTILAYLIGSIPFALIVGKLFGVADIRNVGSKSAGATNVYRTLGLLPYLIVLFSDIAKGYIAVAIALYFENSILTKLDTGTLAVLAVVIGHVYPVFANFRGGKGAATGFGAFLSLTPLAGSIAGIAYLLITFGTGYVSLASIAGGILVATVVTISMFRSAEPYSYILLFVSYLVPILIIVRHRKNIERIIKGEEPKTNFFKKENKVCDKENGD